VNKVHKVRASGERGDPGADRRVSLGMLTLLAVITSFGALSLDLYLPGLPQIQRDLGTSPTAAQLTVTSCIAGLAAGQFASGLIADMAGRRSPLLIGSAVWTLATFCCSLVQSVPELLGLRFIQGLGAGAGVALARSVIADRDPERLLAHLARMFLVLAAVPVIAPTLGALLIGLSGWRDMFVLLGGVGVVYLAGIFFLLEESLPRSSRTRLALWPAVSSCQALLHNKGFRLAALTSGMTFAVMFTYIGTSPFIFREGFGLSAVEYGLLFGGNALSFITGMQVSAAIVTRFGPALTQLVAACLGAGAALTMTLLSLTMRHSLAGAVAPLVVQLFSNGVLMPVSSAAAMSADHRAIAGASGLLGAVQFAVGGAVGALVAIVAHPSETWLALTLVACFGCAVTITAGPFAATGNRPKMRPAARLCPARPGVFPDDYRAESFMPGNGFSQSAGEGGATST
jgi:MFS transporter, DHA1 family, multidrug resistance protein